MKFRFIVLILVALFSLVECSRSPALTPTQTAPPVVEIPGTESKTLEAEVGTESGSGEQPEVEALPTIIPSGETAYPYPEAAPSGSASDSGTPYPGFMPTSSYNPYPEPGSEASATAMPATVQGTLENASSTPTLSINATTLALPTIASTGPTETSPTHSPIPGTPSSGTTAPTVAITPKPRASATATPAPTEEFRLLATDPTTVTLASGEVQLIEFFAFWCGPCRAMAPVINRLESRFAGRVNFIFLDTDDPQTLELRRALRYRDQPHFFLLDERGKVLHQWQGYVEEQELVEALEGVVER